MVDALPVRDLTFKVSTYVKDGLGDFLASYPRILQGAAGTLDTLTLDWDCDEADPLQVDPSLVFPKLRVLDIRTTIPCGTSVIGGLLAQCPTLQVFKCRFAFDLQHDVSLDELCRPPPSLRAWDVTGVCISPLTDAHLDLLGAYGTSLQKLHLDFYHTAVTPEGIGRLCQHRADTLTHLSVNASALTDACVTAMDACRRLTSLHLYQCRTLTDGALESLTQTSALTDLRVDRMLVTSGAQGLFLNMPSLTSIHLEGVPIGEPILGNLARSCPKLYSLKLHECHRLTDWGLMDVIKHCPRLHHLEVYSANVSGEFATFSRYPFLTCVFRRLAHSLH